MDKSTLIQYIQYNIRTSDSGAADAEEIEFRLNRSLERLAARVDLRGAHVQDTISYTADGSYSLPSDFKVPISLYDPNTREFLSRVSKEEYDSIQENAELVYAIDGSNIYIRARGSASSMTLTYLSDNTAKDSGGTLQKGLSAATDEPLVQEQFHQYHAFDVEAELHRKARKYEDYKLAVVDRDRMFKDISDENPKVEDKVVELMPEYDEYYDGFSA